jgi:DNA-binding winged helix-turn-helix (wHTH) protein/tetratricopeptide (TPR) repeat protein
VWRPLLLKRRPNESQFLKQLPEIKRIYVFGPFRLDPGQHLLTRDGEVVPLTRKAFDTLTLLVQNSGRVLEKGEIMESIWPDSFVEEATLAQNIFTLRRVLGESPIEAHYIETVPRLGYRFIAKVSEQTLDEGGSSATVKSLAVLPFKTWMADGSDEYLGLGMADALITRLSNIKGVIVRPTSAVLKYHRQNYDMNTAGRELKVQMALDGIIQRMDGRIRVTVQLVNIEDGAPLWAEKFDENFSNVFAVQDIISERVVDALTVELTSTHKSQLTKHYTKNSEAYVCYLKGCYLWSKWTKEGFEKSITFFERAIEIEPDFALPYTGLADAYTSMGFYGYMQPFQAMPLVKAMARRALRLDNSLAEARLSLATALFFYDWDWAGAEEEFKRSIESNPGYARAHQSYGLYLIAMRRFDEATWSMKKALEADPVSPLIKTTAGFPYYYSGQYELALRQYNDTLEEDPLFGLAHVALGDVYVQMGMHEEAIERYKQGMALWGEKLILPYLGYAFALSNRRDEAVGILKRLEQASKAEYISPFSMAVVCAGLEADDDTFAWLEDSYDERSNKLVFLGILPIFNRLHSDRRFTSLLGRIGLDF